MHIIKNHFCLCPSGCKSKTDGRFCGVFREWRGRRRSRENSWWGSILCDIDIHADSKLQQLPLSTNNARLKKWCLFKWPEMTYSGPQKVARVRHETQIHILNLLITSLELKMPNLALYLLGYEVKKPVSSTTLQDPGQNTAWLYGTCNITNALHWILFSDCWMFKQVYWDVHEAACMPFWVCYKEALRRDQDLYSHNRHLTWLSSATR